MGGLHTTTAHDLSPFRLDPSYGYGFDAGCWLSLPTVCAAGRQEAAQGLGVCISWGKEAARVDAAEKGTFQKLVADAQDRGRENTAVLPGGGHVCARRGGSGEEEEDEEEEGGEADTSDERSGDRGGVTEAVRDGPDSAKEPTCAVRMQVTLWLRATTFRTGPDQTAPAGGQVAVTEGLEI